MWGQGGGVRQGVGARVAEVSVCRRKAFNQIRWERARASMAILRAPRPVSLLGDDAVPGGCGVEVVPACRRQSGRQAGTGQPYRPQHGQACRLAV